MGMSAQNSDEICFLTKFINYVPGNVAEIDGRVAKKWRLGSRPRHSPDPAEVVLAGVPQDLLPTRARGQDDVSLNKLPQIIPQIEISGIVTRMLCPQ